MNIVKNVTGDARIVLIIITAMSAIKVFILIQVIATTAKIPVIFAQIILIAKIVLKDIILIRVNA
jgi:hypothetical protein